jgi:hypothetical protein
MTKLIFLGIIVFVALKGSIALLFLEGDNQHKNNDRNTFEYPLNKTSFEYPTNRFPTIKTEVNFVHFLNYFINNRLSKNVQILDACPCAQGQYCIANVCTYCLTGKFCPGDDISYNCVAGIL